MNEAHRHEIKAQKTVEFEKQSKKNTLFKGIGKLVC